ncbi:MAG: phage tail protein [Rheinheimera sp.]|uniref:phage tail tube protein n=1 Tax=Arsukibacterium sp. UBA3155 TaxID=1946058 RepID=UPI000C8D1E85|nr:phage tail tube protein [Arsukibacterium sp. UBA3155]MAD75162.1 phage tail protein [Rheinheimera sp.]|tara:strand:- start:32914 stop:33399 length:486 start_codon:yes stop_codon:yes gene_type:complete
MSVLTQGTHIFFIDPAGAGTVVQVKRATQFNPGGNPASQIDESALEDLDAQFRKGFRTPGQASMTINADPAEPSHIRLHELSESNDQTQEKLKWVVGWSDGTDLPTVTDGEFVLPTTRTWFKFTGYVSDFPFDFALNTIVTTAVSIQRSGGSQWVKKVPTP